MAFPKADGKDWSFFFFVMTWIKDKFKGGGGRCKNEIQIHTQVKKVNKQPEKGEKINK